MTDLNSKVAAMVAARQGKSPAAPSAIHPDEILRGAGATNTAPILDQMKYPLQRMGAGFMQLSELPTGLYSLGDLGLRLALNTPNQVLPGADRASEITQDLDEGIYDLVGLPKRGGFMDTGSVEDLILESIGGLGIGGIARKMIGEGTNVLQKMARVALAPKTMLGKTAQVGANTGIGMLLGEIPSVEQNQKVHQLVAQREANKLNDRGAHDAVLANHLVKQAKMQGDMQYRVNRKLTGEDEKGWQVPTWMLVAGGLAGLYGASRVAKGPKVWELGEQFGVNAKKGEILNTADLLNAGLTDKNAPITTLLRDAGNEHAADIIDTQQVPGSMRSSMDMLYTTGSLPETPDIKMPKLMDLTNWFQGIAKSGRGETLAQAMRAKDRLAYYRHNVADSVGFGGEETLPELMQKVAAGEGDAELKQFMDTYKQVTDGMAQYLNRMDMIDNETLQKYTQDGYFFMPNIAKGERAWNLLGEFVPAKQYADGFLSTPGSLMKRTNAGMNDEKLMDPIRALEQYTFSMVDFARQNKTRKDFIDTMLKVGEGDVKNVYTGLVKKATPNDKGALPIYRNGKKEFYEITNKAVRDALDFNPQQLEGLMKGMNVLRHGFQYLTTGPGNPLQVPASLLYDAVGASFMTPKGKPLGLVKGDVVGSTLMSLAGSYVGVKDRLYKQAASYLNYAFHNDTVLTSVLGKDVVDRLSVRAADAWQKSTTAMMEKFGASHGGLYHDDAVYQGVQSMMQELSPEFVTKVPGALRVYNLYTSVLDGIQNGARTAYFLRYGKRETDYAKIVRAANETRNLTGDFAKLGNSPAARSAMAMFPYFNPAVQSAKAIGKAFRRNPASTSAALMTGVLLPAAAASYAMSQASMAHRQWYWNELSPYERDAFVWLPTPDVAASMEAGHVVYKSPAESTGIPLLPEARPLAAMSRAIVDELGGLTSGLTRTDQDRSSRNDAGIGTALDDFFNLPGGQHEQDITSSLTQMSPFGLHPLIEAGLASAGVQSSFGAFGVQPIATSVYDESEASARIQTAMGALLGWSGQFALSVADAYRKAPEAKKIDAALEQAGIVAGQKVPIVAGPLFGYQRKLSATTADARIYHSKMDAIKAIQQIVPAATGQLQGRIGPARAPMNAVGTVPNIVGDPATFQMMMTVSKMAPQINQMKLRVDQQTALIKYTRARTDINPKQKALIINTATKRQHQAQNEVVRFIQQNVEGPLQKQSGRQLLLEDLTRSLELDQLAPFPQMQ